MNFVKKKCKKWDFENVNFMKNETLKMWILWKIRLWNCKLCEKWDFKNVNFVIIEISKTRILWKLGFLKSDFLKMWIFQKMRNWKCEFCEKMRLWKCEFCEKWDFQIVNSVKNEAFPLGKMPFYWKKERTFNVNVPEK